MDHLDFATRFFHVGRQLGNLWQRTLCLTARWFAFHFSWSAPSVERSSNYPNLLLHFYPHKPSQPDPLPLAFSQRREVPDRGRDVRKIGLAMVEEPELPPFERLS